jgi:RNA polymerase sigma-70 factor (ECF subfamily)
MVMASNQGLLWSFPPLIRQPARIVNLPRAFPLTWLTLPGILVVGEQWAGSDVSMDDMTPSRLEQLSTNWDLLRQAHGPTADERQLAQEEILKRYTPAIYRYLRGASGDPELAGELVQEFALRFVRGDFRSAAPLRGRFRDYVRRALQNLLCDHFRRHRPLQLDEKAPILATEQSSPEDDQAFLAHWRDRLVSQAFDALLAREQQTGQPFYTVLRLRTDQPDAPAGQMAEILSERMGRPITPEWVRNRLHFARQLFSDLVVAEVARSMPLPSDDDVADELADLGLLDSCRDALVRRRQG